MSLTPAGSAYKVVKQDLKNDKDLDNICSREILGKDFFKLTQPPEHA